MISIVQKPIVLKLFFVIDLDDVHSVGLIIFLLMLVSNWNKFFQLNVFDNIHEHVLIKYLEKKRSRRISSYFYEYFFFVDILYKLTMH